MTKPHPARSRAPVTSLVTVRALRQASPPDAPPCDPYAVMQAMIDGYFRALCLQMAKINAERSKP